MKRTKRVFILLLLAIITVFSVAGCSLGAQNDLQAKIDDLQSQLNDRQSQIEELEDRLAEMEDQLRDRDERIDQLEKEFVEKSVGTFYSLYDAYVNGWVTKADLQTIANYHNNRIPYPESLKDYIAKVIKKSWAKKENDTDPTSDITEEKVSILQYYGTYNECVAVIVDRSDAQYIEVSAPTTIEIGGVSFNYNLYEPVIVIFKL